MPIYSIVIGILTVLFVSNPALAGSFKEPSYRLFTSVVSDDNFFRDNQVHPSGNGETGFPFKIGVKNSYVIDDRFKIPFDLGASYNWYSNHSNSSYSAIDGSLGLTYSATKALDLSLGYSADNYLKNQGASELSNRVHLAASYDLTRKITLKAGLGGLWFNSTPALTYSGSSYFAGTVYNVSRATAVSIEHAWVNRNYTGGVRNDSRNELVLALYQSITKDIVGSVKYFNINSTSNNAIYTYSRSLYSVGIRYSF